MSPLVVHFCLTNSPVTTLTLTALELQQGTVNSDKEDIEMGEQELAGLTGRTPPEADVHEMSVDAANSDGIASPAGVLRRRRLPISTGSQKPTWRASTSARYRLT
jgi:hypothetical protein